MNHNTEDSQPALEGAKVLQKLKDEGLIKNKQKEKLDKCFLVPPEVVKYIRNKYDRYGESPDKIRAKVIMKFGYDLLLKEVKDIIYKR